MSVSLSFDDFNGNLIDDVTVDYILGEIQRVVDGATVRRAGAIIGHEVKTEDGTSHIKTINVEVHDELGCLLYYEQGSDEECVSVGDESRLTERVVNGDGNYSGAGHYIDQDAAIRAIKEFCRDGTADPTIQWMGAADLPATRFWYS